MKIAKLIEELNRFPKDGEIEIECPNGILVDPQVKRYYANFYDHSQGIKYVIGWR